MRTGIVKSMTSHGMLFGYMACYFYGYFIVIAIIKLIIMTINYYL